MRWLAAALLGAIVGPGAWGDEGMLLDGRRLTGDVRRQADGRLYLVGAERTVRLDQLACVRFSGQPLPALQAASLFRIPLNDDQQITGELLGLDADTLRLRTAWAADLRLPRHAVAAVLKVPVSHGPEIGSDEGPDQDSILVTGGDQLFGRIQSADAKGILLEGRFGSRRFSWANIQGFRLRRQAAPLVASQGEHVWLELYAGVGLTLDSLEGVVTGLDERQLKLRHWDLGDLTLDRRCLRHLTWRFFGQRREVDNELHHLGSGDLLPLQPPPPERLKFKQTFLLKAIPARAGLRVRVANLTGPGDGTQVAMALARGMQTEVLVNGRRVDALNALGGRASPRPRWLSLDLPRDCLRPGENVVELRLTPDPLTGRFAGCEVSGIVLEVPGTDE
jgi:hypothetical protein